MANQQANEGLGTLMIKQDKDLEQFINSKTADKYNDLLFGPNENSIYDDKNITAFQKSRKNEIYAFVRLTDFEEYPKLNILELPEHYGKDEDVISEDVIQGHLGDCYLLSALAAFAEFPSRIKLLFEKDKLNERGYYRVNCYLHGIPQVVVIDDYFPVIKDELVKNENGKFNISALAFAGVNKKTYNIWPILLEKVWAKVNSNYENIISGNCSEVFEFFSPAPFKSYIHENAQEEKLFSKLKYYDNKKYVICTDITNYKGGNNTHHEKIIESIKERGLVTNHAYSLIDVAEIKDKLGNDVQLLKVRNPWGNYEWQGDWSDKSDKWTPELKKDLKFEEEEDGTFFISYQDFLKYYTTTHVCMQHDKYFLNFKKFKIRADSKFQEKLITIKVDKETSGYFMINLKNSRIYKNFKNLSEFSNLFVTIHLFFQPSDEENNNQDITLVGSSCGRKNRHFIECEKIKPGFYYFLISFPYKKSMKLAYTENPINYLTLENLEDSKNLTEIDLEDIKEDTNHYNSLDGITYIVSLYSDCKISDSCFSDSSDKLEFKQVLYSSLFKNLISVEEDENKYYFANEGESKAFRCVSFQRNKGGLGFIYLDNPTESLIVERFDFTQLYGSYIKPILFRTDKSQIMIIGKNSQDKYERFLIENLKENVIKNALNETQIKNNEITQCLEYGLANYSQIRVLNNLPSDSILNNESELNSLSFDLIIPPFSKAILQIVKYDEETGVQFKSQVAILYPIFSLINEVKFSERSDTVRLKYKNEEIEIYETLIFTESGIVFKYKNKTNTEQKQLLLKLTMTFSNLKNLKIKKYLNLELLENSGQVKSDLIVDKNSIEENEEIKSNDKVVVSLKPGEVKLFELRVIDPFIEYDYNCEAEVLITIC